MGKVGGGGPGEIIGESQDLRVESWYFSGVYRMHIGIFWSLFGVDWMRGCGEIIFYVWCLMDFWVVVGVFGVRVGQEAGGKLSC